MFKNNQTRYLINTNYNLAAAFQKFMIFPCSKTFTC